MMTAFTLFLTLLMSTSFATEVYVSRDANGNMIFSDRPSANAQVHQVSELPSVPAIAPSTSLPTPAKVNAPDFNYTSLSILSPSTGLQLPMGHAGNVDISGVLVPGLRESDSIYLLDGQNVLQQGRQTSFSLANLDRGEHQLQLQVRDKQGKILIRSNTVIIHVQRASLTNRHKPAPAR